MTSNQIAYQNLLETRRANLAKEEENYRSNTAKESEMHRTNVANERISQQRADNDYGLGLLDIQEKRYATDTKANTDMMKSAVDVIGKLLPKH